MTIAIESWWDLERTTKLLYKALPLVEFTHFRLLTISTEQVAALLPLSIESTNHNGSHFGMAIGMAADTVGALLMGVAAGPVRIIGLHPQHDDKGAAIWLVRSHMDFVRPSVEDLVVCASITHDASERIARRYAAQKRVIEEVTIVCESRGEVVARGTFTYVTQQAHTLKQRTPTARNSLLYQHKITASARSVAAARAIEATQPEPLFVDPWADAVAGPHGRYLAERMTRILPVLPNMIASRTRYFDDAVSQALAEGITQVLILGVGFDTRIARLPIDRTAVSVYEVDLTDMIAAREALLAELQNFPVLRRETAGINLELENLAERIVTSTSFSPKHPCIVLMEGVSFYLDEATNGSVLASLHCLMQHPHSRLALDVVTQEVVTGNTHFLDIHNFVEGMRELGEPFLFGISDPTEYFRHHGYRIQSKIPSNYYRKETPDELYAVYNFLVVSPLAQAGEV